MRKFVNVVLSGLVALSMAAIDADAKPKKKKKPKGHCEKIVDGEHEDLPEFKTKKACKKAGGKWSTKDHNHGEEHHEDDGHDHSGD